MKKIQLFKVISKDSTETYFVDYQIPERNGSIDDKCLCKFFDNKISAYKYREKLARCKNVVLVNDRIPSLY